MKSVIIMICFLAAGDLALFSGAHSLQAWSATRAQLKSFQAYADHATDPLIPG
ncbi:hypothetical protein [Sphingomonas turrisvirgatae]|uniref:hypothetical protein n=1 Tax=Sphingomonas turrisvirgatae TaxID=1888892 RepID=UPI001300D342|nr:hypothetical protein [Sphingomonas turrisvirgatae]